MDLVTSTKKADVFKRLEKLEMLVASRAELVACLSTTKDTTNDCVEKFRAGKKAFEAVARDPQPKPLYVASPPAFLPPLRDTGHATDSLLTNRKRTDMFSDRRFVDATNLCMIYKAFQPFLDRNTPSEEAQACLKSIIEPEGGASIYGQFAPHFKKNGALIRWKGRMRRANLVALSEGDDGEVDDGNVAEARMRVAGRNGSITPRAFRFVLRHLTESRTDDLLLRTLFEWFDGSDKEEDDSIELHAFLNDMDSMLLDYRTEVAETLFRYCSLPGGAGITKGHVYNVLLPTGKLTQYQAQCLIDHFPPDEPIPKVPVGSKRQQEKLQAERSVKILHNFRVGVTMTRKHFENCFEESPYLVICFLDLVLRFAANEFSKPYMNVRPDGTARRKKVTKLQMLGPVWLPEGLTATASE